MADIKEIIANNIISLRKKHNMTQIELAEKLNYSDNAISRWERAEVTPSIETLVHMSEVFGVPLNSIIEDNAVETATKRDRKETINKLAVILLFVSLVWFVAVIAFVYGKLIFNLNLWTIFVWAIPASCLVMYPFNSYWGKYIYKFVILSVFVWSLLGCIYLQLLQYNLWLIFFTGIPIQVALGIWAFIKPKNIKK